MCAIVCEWSCHWWARALGWIVTLEEDGEFEIRPGTEVTWTSGQMIRQQRFSDSWTSERCEPMLAKAMFHGLSFATQTAMNSAFWGRDTLILETE